MQSTRVKLLATLVSAVILLQAAGCATVSPQHTVTQLNVSHPKYASADCVQMRQVALQHDAKIAERAGAGLLLGLLLGPFGLPIALALDAAQNEKSEVVISELKKHCEGEVVTVDARTAPAGAAAPAVVPVSAPPTASLDQPASREAR